MGYVRIIVWAAALTLAAGGCVDGRTSPPPGSDGGPGTGLGAPCAQAGDCASGFCVAVGAGESRCSAPCLEDRACPMDWTCGDVGAARACTCVVSGTETCDGTDQDCDGQVDEGAAAELGCGASEACLSGSCGCSPTNLCGGSCVDTSSDPLNCGACGTACPSGVCRGGSCCAEEAGPARADILFLIDNSNSMAEEQSSFASLVPGLIAILTTGNGGAFPPITDLHLGVVTSDMGAAGYPIPTCSESGSGDDGILQTSGLTCSGLPSFLSYSGGSTTQVGDDASCLAQAGTGGCGFEQQLDAVLKAVSPASPTSWTSPGYVPPTFAGGTSGHGDGANAGFVRDDSTLVVVVLSDEEDCSAADPAIFDPGTESPYFATELNLRCFLHETEALHPIARYVDGLLAVRDDVVFVPIVGVPPDLAPAPGQPPDYDVLVGSTDVRDPRMIPQIDPSMPSRLIPSCSSPGRGIAFPPVRIVQVAQGLAEAGARTSVQSICNDDVTPAVNALVQTIAAPRVRCE